ncbi:Serine/threonine-protein phosphatase 2A activator 1 [Paramicrosporidium saccamoebae]|uniref:Serine/threonine-protein phosphatase 2A activator n=1 Tax=Paramicrosporidium saccamoebae TaxID=1246581 RepID=A0A2H9TKA0_9FUNG|nr:Serine/threonine-protein phosphatase 2A activator 1 [Paramicrosporidium saccamoebae]
MSTARRILHNTDLDAWKSSPAYDAVLSLISKVNTAIMEKKLSQSPSTQLDECISTLLNHMDRFIDQNPPNEMGNQRYGNPAFRAYFATLQAKLAPLVAELATRAKLSSDTVGELTCYLLGSVGNPVRIDYGTGHELSFLGFLASIDQATTLSQDDYVALGLSVVTRYLKLVRRLQICYSLEPAGSHGVWGLDDYQFIPFLFGSAQLVGQTQIVPSAATNPTVLLSHKDEYLYLQAIDFIISIKKGRHFGEYSPMLHDISAIPDWRRINRGLFKMYREEVMHKFPVVQHFEFGKLLKWKLE